MKSSCILFYIMNTVMLMVVAQQPSTSTGVTTASVTTSSQGITGTPLPNNNNNASVAITTMNGMTVGHGPVTTPSSAGPGNNSNNNNNNNGGYRPSLSPSADASMTNRPPQSAPLPDDTVGKNGRLRVSSMAMTIPRSYFYFIITTWLIFLFLL